MRSPRETRDEKDGGCKSARETVPKTAQEHTVSVALRDRNRGKSAIQQSVGSYSIRIAKLPTAALCPSPLVLLVRCAILRVCPRVLPGSMGAVLFYQWVESARLDVALQRELGRKQKRHTDISHVRGRSPVPTLRRKVDNSFSSRPRSSHPSWHSFSL